MRLRLFKLLDVLIVTDPEQIKWLNEHPDVVRPLDSKAGPLQRWINGRLLRDLRFEGEALPVFQPRQDARRAQQQAELANALDEPSDHLGEEREALGAYVAGVATKQDQAAVGVAVQHWCGRLFSPAYRATAATYQAGKLIANWPTTPPWKTVMERVSGRLDKAKKLVSAAAEGDRHRIHGTSIGMENIALSIHNMRELAERVGVSGRSADEAMRQCLRVPPALIRGCEREVVAPFLQAPLTRHSVIIFLLGRAYKDSGDLELAFLGTTWSACPARHVIPEMLRSVWQSAAELKDAREGSWTKVLGPTGQLVPTLMKTMWQLVQKREPATVGGNGKGRVWH